MIALSIALVVVAAVAAWTARDAHLRVLRDRADERSTKARTVEAERLDALEADVRRIDKIIVSRTMGGGAPRR